MAEYSMEEKVISIGRETTRGTAPASLEYVLPVERSSEFEYNPIYVEDEKTRGVKARFAPALVAKEGVASISSMSVEPDSIGAMLYSLFGAVSTSHPGTLAYQHTFTIGSGVENQSYTFMADRQISKKQYTRGVIQSMSLSSPLDDKVVADFEVLFEKEASSTLSTPSISEPNPFKYDHVSVFLADEGASKPGSPDQEIRELTLEIDNQSMKKRTYNQGYDITDIVTPEKVLVSGTFVTYFSTETERDKFLAGTSRSMWIDFVGDEIETSYYYTLAIELPKIFYKAYPWEDQDGMLAASVAFDAYYKVADTKAVQIDLTNKVTEYEPSS